MWMKSGKENRSLGSISAVPGHAQHNRYVRSTPEAFVACVAMKSIRGGDKQS
jgi:hypothetical protein